MTEITSHVSATPAGVAALAAPYAINGSVSSERASHTMRPPGQSAKWRAIGAPICPKPMNPTIVMI
jgi:hypothetical protein